MSEPITLTKRERAVFESLIKYVRGRCANWVSRGDDAPTGNAVARWMEDWLSVGVQSGPGQPIEALDAIRAAMIAVERVGADPRLTDAVNFLQLFRCR